VSSTIEDVARRARVSVATVSRALRGLPNVAPSTRERVLEAARSLEYVADPSASRLAGGRSRTVALVVPMIGQWFYAKLFSGVEAVVVAAGYDLLPITLSGPDGPARFVETLPFRKRADGVVLADVPLTDDGLRRVAGAGVPVVALGLDTDLVPALAVDNTAGARLAVGHLTGLGHGRIALIGGMVDDPFHFSVPVERFRGYQLALAASGLREDPHLVVPGNFSLEGGAEAMSRLLALDHPPTAVFACSDEMAIGAMQVARDAGLRIPEDLSVVGFDDHDVAEYVGLTTIRQDVIGQGERVAAMLLALLADPGLAVASPRPVRHPARLVVRRTTAPPPGGLGTRR
jgi:LacI family transcriptional regulator, repressor for deo operon, udp, cdd, tsx, nupC, and nupG